MFRWEVGVSAGLLTAVVLYLIRWCLRGRVGVVVTWVTVTIALVTGSVVAAPGAHANESASGWNGYVHNAATDCQYVNQNIQEGNPFQRGNPYISTYGSIDGQSKCSNHSYVARSGSFWISQDLLFWTGTTWTTCNRGPVIFNPVAEHAQSTAYGFNPNGYPPCHNNTYFLEASYNYYLNPAGAWDGGVAQNAYIYVSVP